MQQPYRERVSVYLLAHFYFVLVLVCLFVVCLFVVVVFIYLLINHSLTRSPYTTGRKLHYKATCNE